MMLQQHQQDTCRDRIFKLSPIHASVIFRFPEFPEFSESSSLFRKNSIVITSPRKVYCSSFFENEVIFFELDELDELDRITHACIGFNYRENLLV